MANTYTKIASVSVGSGGVATMDFSSIPATYTDLKVVFSTRVVVAGALDVVRIKFNGSTTSFTFRDLDGTGSAAASSSGSTGEAGLSPATTATANTFSNCEVYIPNYAGSTNKSFSADAVSENNATAGYLFFIAGLWSSTAAINQITLIPDTAPLFLQYSTATLYGISNT